MSNFLNPMKCIHSVCSTAWLLDLCVISMKNSMWQRQLADLLAHQPEPRTSQNLMVQSRGCCQRKTRISAYFCLKQLLNMLNPCGNQDKFDRQLSPFKVNVSSIYLSNSISRLRVQLRLPLFISCSGIFIGPVNVMYLPVTDDHLEANTC